MSIRTCLLYTSGTLHLNDELEILGVKEDVLKKVVTGIEMFRKQLDEALAGDNIGALLRGVNRDQIVRGQVLACLLYTSSQLS